MRSTLFLSTCLLSLPELLHALPQHAAEADRLVKRALQTGKLLGTSFGLPTSQTFDYVIVGGGNAGLAVAERLAENSQNLVAVIEAGTFYEISNSNVSQVPLYGPAGGGKSPQDTLPFVDWQFQTTPQAGLQGNPKVHYARGKCLGGSSARNYLNYHVGPSDSYDQWANATGDQTYSFKNFLPFFQKHQAFTPPTGNRPANATPSYDAGSLGKNGPVSVTYARFANSFSSWAEKALASVGVPKIKGLTSGNILGSSYALLTESASSYTRESSETAYFQKLGVQQSNLIIYPETLASKIIFSGTKATGVQAAYNGIPFTLSANKEVIVSAGAFQSPQLLMVSGVGPKATLQGLGIPVVKDLPGVGQGMQDHIAGGPSYRVGVQTTSTLLTPAATDDYINNRNGILTNVGADFLAFEKLPADLKKGLPASAKKDLSTFSAGWPDIEFLLTSAYLGYGQAPLSSSPNDGYNYATVSIALTAPLSRGNVTVSSANMADPPLINPNWLTHPTDQAVAVAAIKRARQVFAAMPQILVGDEYFPGSTVSSDADILSWIQQAFAPLSHASCTCRMGKASDTMAVLDGKARVLGVQGLRVVDASSFPSLPPGHPQGTIYALAEKIANDIKTGS